MAVQQALISPQLLLGLFLRIGEGCLLVLMRLLACLAMPTFASQRLARRDRETDRDTGHHCENDR
ncbi:hypothetical protein BE20_16320 [Sorangium cellulosum]|uniref:Uncharacterized protein n=1 Tax=Sorangium cellulosum TaxID=56 RepID=A0A150SER4_SORCE|nr:hypothetical protein BE20_16320 [Sorangium cellulosum]KYF94677.1 hypothetical protein BE18_07325 [Sorangium cellulosum]